MVFRALSSDFFRLSTVCLKSEEHYYMFVGTLGYEIMALSIFFLEMAIKITKNAPLYIWLYISA